MKLRWLALALAAAGCRVGRDYEPPQLDAPPRFGLSASDASIERDWWKQFGDPMLDELVERALASNLDLKLAAARLREARAVVRIAGGDARPQLDAGGSYARREASTEVAFGQFFPPDDNSFHSLGFQASWEIDLFGRVARGVEAANAEFDMAVEDARAALVVVCADVASHYVTLRGLEEQLAVLASDLASQQERAELVRSRVQAGLEDELALSRIEGSIARTRAQMPLLEREKAAREHALATLVGAWPRELNEQLASTRSTPIPPADLATGLPTELLERRPDVRRAEREIARASALNAQATASLYPSLSIAGAFGVESERLEDLFEPGARTWTLGPSITAPLFRGGLLRAAVEARTAQEEQAILRYERAALEAVRDAETALSAWSRSNEHAAELRRALEAHRLAEQLALERHANGLEDFLSVLDAQRERLVTQHRLAEAATERAAAAVGVYRALGGGWESVSRAAALADAFVR